MSEELPFVGIWCDQDGDHDLRDMSKPQLLGVIARLMELEGDRRTAEARLAELRRGFSARRI
jgi:hypothetical protein